MYNTIYSLHSCFLIFGEAFFFTNSFMNEENIYKVYGHFNVTNGKWYIGSTKQNPKKRWNNGWGYQKQPKMWKDIQESNWNTDWIHTVFDTFSNREDALDYESFLIDMFDAIENGYNTSSYDSHHCKHSEESKKRMSEAKTGKPLSEETRKKMSESHGVNGILQFSKDGEFIAEYPSTKEAERRTGCYHGHICKCCKGKLKSVGGYIWMYAS